MEPLSPAAAATLLRASAAAAAAEIRALPPALAGTRPSDGGWCALEVVGHLLEAERRGFAGRIRLLLDQEGLTFETWDPPRVAAAREDCGRDPEELATELLALREEGARMLETLTPADLERSGEHPQVGRLTVAELLQEWVHHDRAHLMQLLQVTRGFAWEHMGNARRFSEID